MNRFQGDTFYHHTFEMWAWVDPCANSRPAVLNHVEAKLVLLSAAARDHGDEHICDRADEAPTVATDITPEEIMLCAMSDRGEREAAEENERLAVAEAVRRGATEDTTSEESGKCPAV